MSNQGSGSSNPVDDVLASIREDFAAGILVTLAQHDIRQLVAEIERLRTALKEVRGIVKDSVIAKNYRIRKIVDDALNPQEHDR